MFVWQRVNNHQRNREYHSNSVYYSKDPNAFQQFQLFWLLRNESGMQSEKCQRFKYRFRFLEENFHFKWHTSKAWLIKESSFSPRYKFIICQLEIGTALIDGGGAFNNFKLQLILGID